MALKVGCDIVFIPRFEKALREGGEELRRRLFAPHESEGAGPERLAGIFAAKEAALKAVGAPAGGWLEFSLERGEDGAPRLSTTLPWLLEVSISHDGDYALAVVAASEEEKNGQEHR
ncbi:MAG: hypothetical protein FD189_2063 [Elusimicrobia bacterium]|nr:MAG: hypothetical protein FD154_2362 [Elusimicrobiota bacterium]KAF0154155.1 MAG: hypothetical protein FD189_2063 [Elusimicrobiota bacterium]